MVKAGKGGIKYEFRVAPGADWRRIRIRYEGIASLALRPGGALEIRPAAGWPVLADAAPVIYQEASARAGESGAAERAEIPGRFRLTDARVLTFNLTGSVDPARPLVIDPDLVWSTYIGGVSSENGMAVATDDSGNIYVTGWTDSANWVSGGYDTSHGGVHDAFVVKISPEGQHVWSTYLGGAGNDVGYGIAVGHDGDVYVTGATLSAGWVSGGYDTTYNAGEVFVAKLSPSGQHLWSSYLGGSDNDGGFGVAVDNSDNVYVTGYTHSPNWTFNGYDTSYYLVHK